MGLQRVGQDWATFTFTLKADKVIFFQKETDLIHYTWHFSVLLSVMPMYQIHNLLTYILCKNDNQKGRNQYARSYIPRCKNKKKKSHYMHPKKKKINQCTHKDFLSKTNVDFSKEMKFKSPIKCTLMHSNYSIIISHKYKLKSTMTTFKNVKWKYFPKNQISLQRF